MDQVAHWVRFADTKATILAAGLGVFMTMVMANSATIATAFNHGCLAIFLMTTLGGWTAGTFLYTLVWLMRAITPRNEVPYLALNRFAWPTLAKVTAAQLNDHIERGDVGADAWQQTIDLSVVAQGKFDACARAVKGFAGLVIAAVVTIATAVGFTAT